MISELRKRMSDGIEILAYRLLYANLLQECTTSPDMGTCCDIYYENDDSVFIIKESLITHLDGLPHCIPVKMQVGDVLYDAAVAGTRNMIAVLIDDLFRAVSAAAERAILNNNVAIYDGDYDDDSVLRIAVSVAIGDLHYGFVHEYINNGLYCEDLDTALVSETFLCTAVENVLYPIMATMQHNPSFGRLFAEAVAEEIRVRTYADATNQQYMFDCCGIPHLLPVNRAEDIAVYRGDEAKTALLSLMESGGYCAGSYVAEFDAYVNGHQYNGYAFPDYETVKETVNEFRCPRRVMLDVPIYPLEYFESCHNGVVG